MRVDQSPDLLGPTTGSYALTAQNTARPCQTCGRECVQSLRSAHHHGTFQLTDETIDAPVLALIEALNTAGIAPERFTALQPGQVGQHAP